MSAVPESGGTPARRDVPEAGHDAVWMIASPHARWASASGDVQALSVASDEVCCTLHGAPADTMTWLERLRHGVLLTHAPAPGTWLATLVDEGLVQALPATRDGTVTAFGEICDAWVRGIFAAPFWTRFLAGESSEIQVLAFLAQLYHRAAGRTSTIALRSSAAPTWRCDRCCCGSIASSAGRPRCSRRACCDAVPPRERFSTAGRSTPRTP
ncbi:hypothetical protein LV28_09615 [Pandoraea pnomenusa]|uniref:hypothetical protein n=1 Tax=Pandoraea pnomenusa TaxID=93220 RepID=UPI00052119E8|nr:hypothetical protein [Pandoraea pnomenusa]AIU26766.1 hypothetical protein LV28_09615 [Pandoraea pnomenusa]